MKMNLRNIKTQITKITAELDGKRQQFKDTKSDIVRVAKASNGKQDDWWIKLTDKDNESTNVFAFEVGDNRRPVCCLSLKKQREALGDTVATGEYQLFAGRHAELVALKESKKALSLKLNAFELLLEEAK